MPTEVLRTVGRTRNIEDALYIERWVQKNAAVDVIFGETGDLNRLDALADSETSGGSGAWWFGAPSLGESSFDQSDTWWGQALRIPFKRVGQASGQWHTLHAKLEAFVQAAFPGETIFGANERVDRPTPGDAINNPSKFVYWSIDGE